MQRPITVIFEPYKQLKSFSTTWIYTAIQIQICFKYIKGSCDDAKDNTILHNAEFRWFNVKKNTLLLLLPASPFWNAVIFTKLILKSTVCSDWPAIQSVVIGRIPQACDENTITYFEAHSISTAWRRRQQQYYSEN